MDSAPALPAPPGPAALRPPAPRGRQARSGPPSDAPSAAAGPGVPGSWRPPRCSPSTSPGVSSASPSLSSSSAASPSSPSSASPNSVPSSPTHAGPCRGTRSPKGSPAPPLSPDPSKPDDLKKRAGTREAHNKLEKHRRAQLKESFEALKRNVPNMGTKKTSNLDILRGSLKYIQVLKRKERECEHEVEWLAREKIGLQQRLAALRNELSSALEPHEVEALVRDASGGHGGHGGGDGQRRPSEHRDGGRGNPYDDDDDGEDEGDDDDDEENMDEDRNVADDDDQTSTASEGEEGPEPAVVNLPLLVNSEHAPRDLSLAEWMVAPLSGSPHCLGQAPRNNVVQQNQQQQQQQGNHCTPLNSTQQQQRPQQQQPQPQQQQPPQMAVASTQGHATSPPPASASYRGPAPRPDSSRPAQPQPACNGVPSRAPAAALPRGERAALPASRPVATVVSPRGCVVSRAPAIVARVTPVIQTSVIRGPTNPAPLKNHNLNINHFPHQHNHHNHSDNHHHHHHHFQQHHQQQHLEHNHHQHHHLAGSLAHTPPPLVKPQ
uniref:Max-binding protein MNT n=1 Tax=Petromyzon marinus TaxID=7757 RepID=A0AAJ7WME8_PETMA|nr:max-binding protein MNT-like [Petromyzon marinus]